MSADRAIAATCLPPHGPRPASHAHRVRYMHAYGPRSSSHSARSISCFNSFSLSPSRPFLRSQSPTPGPRQDTTREYLLSLSTPNTNTNARRDQSTACRDGPVAFNLEGSPIRLRHPFLRATSTSPSHHACIHDCSLFCFQVQRESELVPCSTTTQYRTAPHRTYGYDMKHLSLVFLWPVEPIFDSDNLLP